MNEETIRHESFGQIQFSRITGHNRFYGSELEQDHYIELTVSQSEVRRDLSSEHYYSDQVPIVRLRLSAGQFAELITSMNIGSGVCCTLERIGAKRIEPLPEIESRKELVHRHFKERMEQFSQRLSEDKVKAMQLVKKKTLTKDDIHELSRNLNFLTQEIESNIPFFMECFQEVMDKVVLEAKTEVENAIMHKITSTGLQELHRQNVLLETKKEE